MKDLTKFLVGTTVPTLTDDASIPCFGRSEENFKLMRDAGVKIVRIFSSFPFTDESMTEESMPITALRPWALFSFPASSDQTEKAR